MSSPTEAIVPQSLRGHLALVTGATGGIGRASCLALARHGCNIAAHYHRASDKADALVSELSRLGVTAVALQADLRRYDDVRRLHAEVVARAGRPSILFSNAGTTLGRQRLTAVDQLSVDEFEETWRANCGAPFLLAQLCVPDMQKAGFGRVVFCSSVAAFTGGVVGPHYASSKSALHGLIHWLSNAYCKAGITVNGVAPALIEDTAMLPGGSAELAEKIPVGRLGKPEEIAETVIWMVRTGYVTNKVIAVDGGMFVQ